MSVKKFNQFNEDNKNFKLMKKSEMRGYWSDKGQSFGGLQKKPAMDSFPLRSILEKYSYKFKTINIGTAKRADAALPTEEAAKPNVIPFYIMIGKFLSKETLIEDLEDGGFTQGDEDYELEMKGMMEEIGKFTKDDPIEFTVWLPFYSDDQDTMEELVLTYAKMELEKMKASLTLDYGKIPEYWDRGNMINNTEQFTNYWTLSNQKMVNDPGKVLEMFFRVDNRLYQNSKLIENLQGREHGNNTKELLEDFSNYRSDSVQSKFR